MSDTYFRYDGVVQTPQGNAVAGASIAVLGDDPPDFSTQPGSPLLDIFSGPNSNSATITAAQWIGGQLTFTFSTTPPDDVVEDSYISVEGANPSSFDGIYQVIAVDGNNVIVGPVINSPGTYISGGTVATSVLPNPLASDGNGRFFFYVLPGLVAVQIYGGAVLINELDLPDQGVGTVAGGSVTSVALKGDGVLFETAITGSPITGSGTLDLSLSIIEQDAATFLAGPVSGPAAAPTFRAIQASDLPDDFGTVSSVAIDFDVPGIFTSVVTGSPITTDGTITIELGLETEAANTVFAGPTSGGSSVPTFRALVAADIPGTVILSTVTLVTSAQLLALNGTQVQLVPAPPTGFVNIPLYASYRYNFVTTPYSVGGSNSVIGTAAAIAATDGIGAFGGTGVIDQTVSTYFSQEANYETPVPVSDLGGAIVLGNTGSNFTDGDGTMTVTIYYALQPTS
jgi:hypothetical protein